MPIEKNENKIIQNQKLILENRENLSLSGVNKIESFSDTEIALITNFGKLSIKGENLHINSLNVDTGEFSSSGKVNSMHYFKISKQKTKFIERIFK